MEPRDEALKSVLLVSAATADYSEALAISYELKDFLEYFRPFWFENGSVRRLAPARDEFPSMQLVCYIYTMTLSQFLAEGLNLLKCFFPPLASRNKRGVDKELTGFLRLINIGKPHE